MTLDKLPIENLALIYDYLAPVVVVKTVPCMPLAYISRAMMTLMQAHTWPAFTIDTLAGRTIVMLKLFKFERVYVFSNVALFHQLKLLFPHIDIRMRICHGDPKPHYMKYVDHPSRHKKSTICAPYTAGSDVLMYTGNATVNVNTPYKVIQLINVDGSTICVSKGIKYELEIVLECGYLPPDVTVRISGEMPTRVICRQAIDEPFIVFSSHTRRPSHSTIFKLERGEELLGVYSVGMRRFVVDCATMKEDFVPINKLFAPRKGIFRGLIYQERIREIVKYAFPMEGDAFVNEYTAILSGAGTCGTIYVHKSKAAVNIGAKMIEYLSNIVQAAARANSEK